MFLDVKELAVRKLSLRKSYAPGAIDYQTSEIKQVEPLEVTATAELFDGTQIRITGELETKLELACARCLEPVTEEVHRSFDLFYSPLPKLDWNPCPESKCIPPELGPEELAPGAESVPAVVPLPGLPLRAAMGCPLWLSGSRTGRGTSWAKSITSTRMPNSISRERFIDSSVRSAEIRAAR